MDYKKEIIEMVKSIKDPWILKQIYRCIMNALKEGN